MIYIDGENFDDLEPLLSYINENRIPELYHYCKEKVIPYKNGKIPHCMPWYC